VVIGCDGLNYQEFYNHLYLHHKRRSSLMIDFSLTWEPAHNIDVRPV
jgi:hypothetical protein